MNQLYIGNLPVEATEESLRELFYERSKVVPKNVLVKKGGYAFVECPDEQTAKKAIELLNGFTFMNSELLVEPSVPQGRRSHSNKIHVSNIPNSFEWDQIRTLLTTFGEVQHCVKGPTKSENSYHVFVTYQTSDQAQQAFTELNGYEIEGLPLKVDFVMDQGHGNLGGRTNRGLSRSFPYSGNSPNSMRPTDFPLRILVFSDMVGAIIGRAGGTIRRISQESRARVDVHRKENAGSFEKVITIYGDPENCSLACKKILEVVQQEAENSSRGGIHDVNSYNMERIVTIVGKLENTSKAEQMISSKLRQSYENDLSSMAPQTLMFPGVHPMAMMSTMGGPGCPPAFRGTQAIPPYGMYNLPCMPQNYHPGSVLSNPQDPRKEQVFLYIPNTAVGAIIGTGGSSIRDMICSSGASIKIAQPDKDEPLVGQTERKVTIIGTSESQWKAQFMIFKKVSYEGFAGPQDIRLRVEIFVPSSQVGRVIGKGGQTIREMQRITQAMIKVSEESQNIQADETPICITGDFYSSQAAQHHIRTLVTRSQTVTHVPGCHGLLPTPPQSHCPGQAN
ncbi:insulin-like growth factor 2 mRNA-binding protein 1 isoform X2 [Tachypleus tridentatus]|uniref:insulin-like growth factor 2 mRNA-binding protein 1 isoform X2 n=1 Tax=Tachypleus tridentatus TaxID=6853 RepID=UPI003FCFB51E